MKPASDLHLHQLRQFVAVAEELHFGRAATQLGMTQPPLSQAIQRLEASIGAPLLERDKHKVSLTRAGTVLLGEARKLLSQAAMTQQLVQRAASGELSRLSIGFTPMTAMDALPQAIRDFRKRWRGVDVRLIEKASKATADGLRDGSLELGLISVDLADTSGLEVRTIERARVLLAVPWNWPIARNKSVQFKDLAGLPFVLFPQQRMHQFHVHFEAACAKAGFTPLIAQQAAQPYTMFNLVAHELGVGLVQESARCLAIAGISFVEIEDLPEGMITESALAWLPRHVPPTLQSMIELIEQRAHAAAPL